MRNPVLSFTFSVLSGGAASIRNRLLFPANILVALVLLMLVPNMRAQDVLAKPKAGNHTSRQPKDRPRFELRPGEKYLRDEGRPVFVLGRNPVGMDPKAYEEHFRHAAEAGERLMRIHFTFMLPREKAGDIDPGMLASWDAILDAAENRGLAVLPVLGVWADWNDGSNKETWHRWDRNPFNVERGGPARRPSELFDDSPCRRLWLKRLETFITRWSNRHAIVAWELFSELDLVTGATEQRAVEFVERAAAVVRAADPWKRPITASQCGIAEWPKLIKSTALDFNEIHPYADGTLGGRLDDLILSAVRSRLATYGKPVLIGESGLNSGPPRETLEDAPCAAVGIRHAIWAAIVSGAMNGRALWWQDGYDQFEKAELCRHYHQAAMPAALLVRGIDFSGFVPVRCVLSTGLKGAVIGNDKVRLAWMRDVRCDPPDWPMLPVSGQTLTVNSFGLDWQVEFFDTTTGEAIGKSQVTVRDQRLLILLPEFRGSIGVQLKRLTP